MHVVIPTVPSRATALGELIARLETVAPDFAFHPLTSTGNSREDVAQAVHHVSSIADPWALWLEDDAWPCPGFGARVLSVLEGVGPVDVVCLFSRRAVHDSHGLHVQGGASLPNTVALALRPSALRGMAMWLPSWYASHLEHSHASDLALAEWLRLGRRRIAVHSPSIVQHRPGPSTFRGRSRTRLSKTYTVAFGAVPPLPEPP